MNRVFQTRFGKEGNCFAACLASLFEVPLEQVDQCACNNPTWAAETDAFLARYGLYMTEVKAEPTGELGNINPPPDGSLCMYSVKGSLPHVVIGRAKWNAKHPCGSCANWDVEIVHDPYSVEGRGAHDARAYEIRSILLLCAIQRENETPQLIYSHGR